MNKLPKSIGKMAGFFSPCSASTIKWLSHTLKIVAAFYALFTVQFVSATPMTCSLILNARAPWLYFVSFYLNWCFFGAVLRACTKWISLPTFTHFACARFYSLYRQSHTHTQTWAHAQQLQISTSALTKNSIAAVAVASPSTMLIAKMEITTTITATTITLKITPAKLVIAAIGALFILWIDNKKISEKKKSNWVRYVQLTHYFASPPSSSFFWHDQIVWRNETIRM